MRPMISSLRGGWARRRKSHRHDHHQRTNCGERSQREHWWRFADPSTESPGASSSPPPRCIRNKNPQHSSRSSFQVRAQFSAMPGEAHRQQQSRQRNRADHWRADQSVQRVAQVVAALANQRAAPHLNARAAQQAVRQRQQVHAKSVIATLPTAVRAGPVGAAVPAPTKGARRSTCETREARACSRFALRKCRNKSRSAAARGFRQLRCVVGARPKDR
jgi:hypothetical protein